jgi:hypothetical protein
MLLLNILLRPSLMVIGFFMSYVLINVFTLFAMFILHEHFISTAMTADPGSIATTFGAPMSFAAIGPIGYFASLAATLVIIGMVLTVVVHKSLNLVTWLPENAIKWAGGESVSLGEQSDERRVAAVFGQMQSSAYNRMPKMAKPGGGGTSANAAPPGGQQQGQGQGQDPKKDQPDTAGNKNEPGSDKNGKPDDPSKP